jgi:hypothetical protein
LKKLLPLAALLLALNSASGQGVKYGGLQQFGLAFSEQHTNILFNFVNGVRFKRFFIGIGADARFRLKNLYYYGSPSSYNTAAVFGDVRYYLNEKKNFFLLGNGGINFITEELSSGPREGYKRPPGYYTSFGVGFKAKMGKEIYYSFDVNYSIRQTKLEYNYRDYFNQWQSEKYDLLQRAILVRMGIEIF